MGSFQKRSKAYKKNPGLLKNQLSKKHLGGKKFLKKKIEEISIL